MGSLYVSAGLFPKTFLFPSCSSFIFTTTYHPNGLMGLISLFHAALPQPLSLFHHLYICEHSCVCVCVGQQVLTPRKPQQKCGEKSVWTEIINIQWWRSDLFLSPLYCVSVFFPFLSETSCRLKRRRSLWIWQHAWQWPHLCSHICHPSVSSYFQLSVFPFCLHLSKGNIVFSLSKRSTFLGCKWANHISFAGQRFSRHKQTASGIVGDCRRTKLEFSALFFPILLQKQTLLG